MEITLNSLNQKAIKAALNSNWSEAITLNEEILQQNPNDMNVKLRLGKAYLQASEFSKAKMIFKEVLDKDPINKIAQKNLELAKSQKKETESNLGAKVGLIKEPGTSNEIYFDITEKGITANNFSRGDSLELHIVKAGVMLQGYRGNNLTDLGLLEKSLANKIYEAKKEGAVIKAVVLSGKDKKLEVLLSSTLPIFKSRKQETKPYVKKGALDEDMDE